MKINTVIPGGGRRSMVFFESFIILLCGGYTVVLIRHSSDPRAVMPYRNWYTDAQAVPIYIFLVAVGIFASIGMILFICNAFNILPLCIAAVTRNGKLWLVYPAVFPRFLEVHTSSVRRSGALTCRLDLDLLDDHLFGKCIQRIAKIYTWTLAVGNHKMEFNSYIAMTVRHWVHARDVLASLGIDLEVPEGLIPERGLAHDDDGGTNL